jgi:Ribonuclease G/E
MNTRIRVAASPGQAHVAVTRGDALIDYALWHTGAPDGVGDVLEGRVTTIAPAMAGAFVALTSAASTSAAQASAEGFLPDSEGAKGLSQGASLLVRVTRSAQGGKGPRLTARLPEGTQPGPGPNPVARLATHYPNASILVDDPNLAAQLGARYQAGVLDEPIADAIDALAQSAVDVPSGGRLSIWPTPALVAIDVDSAGALDRHSGPAAQRHEAFNKSLLAALAAQIRLRNLSGAIVIDLAGMPVKRRPSLAPDLRAALQSDPLKPRFLGFTALGLAEIVRTRIHPPLHELLVTPLSDGLAALRAVLAAGSTDPRAQPAIHAHPAIVAALRADPDALPDMLRRTGRSVMLRADPSLPPHTWMLDTRHA